MEGREIYWSVDEVNFNNMGEGYTYSDFEEVFNKYYYSELVFTLTAGKTANAIAHKRNISENK